MISNSSIFKAPPSYVFRLLPEPSIVAQSQPRGKPMKLDTFAYSASAGWSVEPLPELDSENTLVVVFGAPELDHVQEPLRQLVATYSRSHVVGCSTAGEIFGTALTDNSLSVAVAQFENGTHVGSAAASVDSQDESFAA